jgi:hypothetical protein
VVEIHAEQLRRGGIDMLDIYTATLGAKLELLRRDIDALGESTFWHVIHPPGASFTGGVAARASLCCESRSCGLYSALNEVCATSGQERWLSYVNDDDRLLGGFGKMVKLHLAEANENVIAFGRVNMCDEHGASLYEFPFTDRMHDLAPLWAESIMPFTQQGMIFSRLVWETLGGFDERYRYSGDLDFWVRAHLAGFTFKFYDLPVAAWSIRPGQLSGHRAAVQLETERALAPIREMNLSWVERKLAKLRFRLRNSPQYIRRGLKLRRLRQAEVFG